MANRTRPVRGLAALLLALIAGAPAPAAGHDALAAHHTIGSFSVSGSPFAINLPPLPGEVEAQLVLTRFAKVAVRVFSKRGNVVRVLRPRSALGAGTYQWTWDGRNGTGAFVGDGIYEIRVRAENGLGTAIAKRRIRKGLPQMYPANPGAIMVAVDPGHGGRLKGAVADGFAEKAFNLDISLKLQALLAHAGVQVVMTRTTDVAALEPPSDYNGDGKVNRYDDDLMRNDVKNLARADVAVHVHNNAATNTVDHGTGIYVDRGRSWKPLAVDLAQLLLAEELAALEPYRSPVFSPHSTGVHFGWYYYMGPYDPPYLPRPSLVTSVLSESLYMSNSADLETLKRPEVRTSLAAGIYIGLARWLNTRDVGIGYELIQAPGSPVAAGAPASYGVRVTNRGNSASDAWTLQLHSVPAVPLYDGSGQLGDPMGSVAVPDGLAPGESVELTIAATAPASAGSWLVKADTVLGGGGDYASAMGIVALQMPLTTVAP